MKWLIRLSIKLGVNKIDWLRTVYFSLFGSSTLSYALKWKSLDFETTTYFVGGIMLFLIGLIVSMRISDSFKEYEGNFKALDKETKKQFDESLPDYIIISRENGLWKFIQHMILYTFFFLAIILIGYSSYLSEIAANKDKNFKNSDLEQFAKVVNSYKSSLDSIMISAKNLHNLELKNYQILDSLKKAKYMKETEKF